MKTAYQSLIKALGDYSSTTHVPLLLFICPEAPSTAANTTRALVFRALELDLTAQLEQLPNIYCFGSSDICRPAEPDRGRFFCEALDRAAHSPYSAALWARLAVLLARQIGRVGSIARKVVVLDCDNTLWGGVVGEVGPAHVQLSEPFLLMQHFMLALQRSGVLLCLCRCPCSLVILYTRLVPF